MSYELSFTESFFTGDHEPGKTDKPTNLLEAIYNLSRKDRLELAKNVLGAKDKRSAMFMIDSESFDYDIVEAARQVNTCRDLASPVEVYLDEDGWHTVLVYD